MLGLLTFVPPVHIVVFMFAIFAMFIVGGTTGEDTGLGPFSVIGFILLIALHVFVVFLTLGLTVFYIIHALKNDKLDQNLRIIWVLLIFFGAILTMPAYYFMNIWKEPLAPVADERKTLGPPAAADEFAHYSPTAHNWRDDA